MTLGLNVDKLGKPSCLTYNCFRHRLAPYSQPWIVIPSFANRVATSSAWDTDVRPIYAQEMVGTRKPL